MQGTATIDRDKLSKAVSILGETVGSETSSIPILSMAHLSFDQGRFTFATTIMRASTVIDGICTTTGDAWSVCVPFIVLKNIVSLLRGDTVEFDFDDSLTAVLIKSGGYKGKLNFMDADEYPNLTTTFDSDPTNLPLVWLERVFPCVGFAAADEHTNPVLQCIKLHAEGNKAVAAAIDGYRLAELTHHSTDELTPFEALIPAESFKAVHAAIKQGWFSTVAEVGVKGNKLIFRGSNLVMTLQLADEARFPEYERFIPDQETLDTSWSFNAKVADVEHEAKLASVTAAGGIVIVQLAEQGMFGKSLQLHANDTGGKGESTGELKLAEIKGPTPDLQARLALNVKFLQGMLKACPTESLTFFMRTPNSPLYAETDNWRTILMPMRIP